MSKQYIKPLRPESLGFLTIVFGSLPFIIYLFQRNTGLLPGEIEWYRSGVNHGPWRYNAEAITIFFPILVLAVVSVGLFFFKHVKREDFWKICCILVMQLAFLVAQFYWLTWTID